MTRADSLTTSNLSLSTSILESLFESGSTSESSFEVYIEWHFAWQVSWFGAQYSVVGAPKDTACSLNQYIDALRLSLQSMNYERNIAIKDVPCFWTTFALFSLNFQMTFRRTEVVNHWSCESSSWLPDKPCLTLYIRMPLFENWICLPPSELQRFCHSKILTLLLCGALTHVRTFTRLNPFPSTRTLYKGRGRRLPTIYQKNIWVVWGVPHSMR